MFAGLKIIKLILDSLFNVRSDGSNQSSIYGQTTSTQLGTRHTIRYATSIKSATKRCGVIF